MGMVIQCSALAWLAVSVTFYVVSVWTSALQYRQTTNNWNRWEASCFWNCIQVSVTWLDMVTYLHQPTVPALVSRWDNVLRTWSYIVFDLLAYFPCCYPSRILFQQFLCRCYAEHNECHMKRKLTNAANSVLGIYYREYKKSRQLQLTSLAFSLEASEWTTSSATMVTSTTKLTTLNGVVLVVSWSRQHKNGNGKRERGPL